MSLAEIPTSGKTQEEEDWKFDERQRRRGSSIVAPRVYRQRSVSVDSSCEWQDYRMWIYKWGCWFRVVNLNGWVLHKTCVLIHKQLEMQSSL